MRCDDGAGIRRSPRDPGSSHQPPRAPHCSIPRFMICATFSQHDQHGTGMIERATDTVIALVDRLPALDYKNLLFPPLWTGLTRIYLGMAVSLLLFGFFYPYWRFADMDFMLAYQGLLFNDGRPQEYFDHTAYPYYLGVGAWYWLCHWL